MNINFTIIVQAFNFLIAYFILRFFLFKPAVAEIDKEKVIESDLQMQIDQGHRLNNLLERENQNQWRIHQLNFSQQTPKVSTPELFVFRNIASEINAPMQDQTSFESAQQKIIEVIVDKVSHVQT
jgi:hypothetical protein